MKIITFALATLLAFPAVAQDIVPVEEGKLVPYTGMLVPEDRFIELLEAEIELEGLKRKYEVEKRFNEAMETMYKKKLEEAVSPPDWYETPTANRWFGFILGIAATGLAVWGGTEMVKAIR